MQARQASIVLLLLASCPGAAGPTRLDDAGQGPDHAATAVDGGGRPDALGGADLLPLDLSVAADQHGAEAGPPVQCTPGKIASESCGACDSGLRTKFCTAQGQWSAWGACTGAETGFPVAPASGALVCPPYSWPAVFVSPHPDDESISMAGAIAEHVGAGRQVFVELMTRGQASGVINALQNGGTCPWHSGSHVYALSKTAFGDARLAEFMQATKSLKVTGVFLSDFGDGDLTVSEVKQRINFWKAHADPLKGVSFKGSIGTTQSGAGGANHPDHIAVWSALTSSGLSDLRGYTSSLFTPTSGKPVKTVPLGASACSAKGAALAAYKLWSPAGGRYAVGYHSVKTMIDSMVGSCEEYVLFYTP